MTDDTLDPDEKAPRVMCSSCHQETTTAYRHNALVICTGCWSSFQKAVMSYE